MKPYIFAAALAAVAVNPAVSADTGVVAVYEATPEQLWSTVDFHQPSENIMPPIASSRRTGEGVGATKINKLASDGAEIHLLLAYYDPTARAFNYTIQQGPLPVKNYVGQVRVTDAGAGRAQLSWQGTYEPDGVSTEQADEILGGFYAAIAEKIGGIYKRVP